MLKHIPNIEGVWKIRGLTIGYENPTMIPPNVANLDPIKVRFDGVIIKQNGRFFSYNINTERLPKLGVMEPVVINGKLKGWKGHMVDAKFDNDYFIFNFIEFDEKNNVTKFDITYLESGFEIGNPEQVPRVEYAIAKRVC